MKLQYLAWHFKALFISQSIRRILIGKSPALPAYNGKGDHRYNQSWTYKDPGADICFIGKISEPVI